MIRRHMAFAAVPFIAAGALVSCWPSPADDSAAPQSQVAEPAGVVPGDNVAVDYVLRLEDGTIFDSTIAEEARKGRKFDPKRAYAPVLFSVGDGKMPLGLEKGVVGMLAGEKRTLRVPPGDGYGSATEEVAMAKRLLEGSYRETVSRSKYRDTFETVVPDNAFADQGRPVPQVGDAISSGGVTSRVVKVENGLVTLSVENGKNPFRGKTLAVGLQGIDDGNHVRIVSLDRDNVTVEVRNDSGPFSGRNLAVWASAVINGQLHTVKSIGDETVLLTRGHELVGKNLVFEVELKEIK